MNESAQPAPAPPKVYAVGGGKGGVGKSIVSANLAIAAAEMGMRVVLVDADLGGANLHAMIGLLSPKKSLADFLTGKKSELAEIVLDTRIANLRIVSGAGNVPGIANILYQRKMKFIRHLRRLDTDIVLLDLSPGIAFNVVDLFLAADEGVLVTNPEVTALTNTFSFIRAAVFRRLFRSLPKEDPAYALLRDAKDPIDPGKFESIEDLVSRIGEISAVAHGKIGELLSSIRPKIILNMIAEADQVEVGSMLKELVKENLNVEIECIGYILETDDITESIYDMKPILLSRPKSVSSLCIRHMAHKLFQETPKAGGS